MNCFKNFHLTSVIFQPYYFWFSNFTARLGLVLAMILSFYSAHSQDWIVTEVGALPVSVSNNAVCEGFVGNVPYLFSFGGIDSTKLHSGIHLKSYKYNLLTNETSAIADLPDNMGKIAAGANRIDSIIYIIGGYHVFSNGSELSSAKTHRYNVMTDNYLSDGVPIPIPIDDHVQAVWRDSLIFVVTGWSNTTNRREVQIYDPANDIWASGTSVPNNNSYKSFGASGTIVGDTIYYYGGASLSGSFNIQNQLRKGVINPDNPTDISWSVSVPDSQIKGYRMACTTVFDQIHWIGGSAVTYNFDGIAYNNTGGVPPINRDLYIRVDQPSSWNESLTNEFPMDLRGIASINDTLKFLAGGMLANQAVTNKVYRLEWDGITAINKEPLSKGIDLRVYPNPLQEGNDLQLEWEDEKFSNAVIEISNSSGRKLISMNTQNRRTVALSNHKLSPGLYFVKFIIGNKYGIKKLIVL